MEPWCCTSRRRQRRAARSLWSKTAISSSSTSRSGAWSCSCRRTSSRKGAENGRSPSRLWSAATGGCISTTCCRRTKAPTSISSSAGAATSCRGTITSSKGDDMKTRLTKLPVAALLAALPAAPPLAQQKLKFAHGYETSEADRTAGLWAAGEIAKRTGNRYTVDVFPASSLGNETQINQSLTLATVDMIYTGQLFAGRSHGPISIGGAPFMFRDFDHLKKYAGSALFRELAAGYPKASGGNTVVAITYYGNRQTTPNKALNRPEDMKGLKIRVPDAPLYTLFPRAVGASPTPIAFAEVYLALQNGTVEAQENPLPTIDAKKFYEVQSHINLTAHITDALLTIIGGPLWAKLSESDRKIFEAVYKEAALRATGEIIDIESRLAGEFAKRGKRSEEHTSELQSPDHLVCRLLLEKKKRSCIDCAVSVELQYLSSRNVPT